MNSLTEVFEKVEDKTKRTRNPVEKLRFIEDAIDWVNTLLDLLKKIKKELGEVK